MLRGKQALKHEKTKLSTFTPSLGFSECWAKLKPMTFQLKEFASGALQLGNVLKLSKIYKRFPTTKGKTGPLHSSGTRSLTDSHPHRNTEKTGGEKARPLVPHSV